MSKFDLQLFAEGGDGTGQGTQNAAQTGAGDNTASDNKGSGQDNKTFTQAELEAVLADRLRREREKYKDYADLKKAAEEYQKIKEAQMSEQEKLQAKLAEYERKLQEKEREAEAARLEALKLKVLDEMGLPKAWAARVFGKTEDEIKADAEALKKLLGAQTAKTTIGGATNPATAAKTEGKLGLAAAVEAALAQQLKITK